MTARVLVVDDVLPNVRLLEARLNAEYFEVLAATNGPEAIAICELGGCDIVLLDVMMPGMGGLQVCRALRAKPETAHLPPSKALDKAREENVDLIIVSLGLSDFHGLRICSQARSQKRTRSSLRSIGRVRESVTPRSRPRSTF